MFRGILVRQLKVLVSNDKLRLPEGFGEFGILKYKLYQKNWNVYSKKAFGGINGVLRYLGRYTHRVAISNNRLISLSGKEVTFSYKDYRQGHKQKRMTLSNVEFVRRFLQHVLPSGFFKIRYIGVLAIVHIHGKREQIISLVGKTIWLSGLEGLPAYDVLRSLTGKDPSICPACKKGIMVRSITTPKLE